MKKLTVKNIHLTVLILGTAFILGGAFNDPLWFDETYSVGLVRLPFGEMISAAADDVHPFFYYILLWLVARLPGGIVTLRLFGAILGAGVAWLGFTHLRHDLGEKAGAWYSAIVFLLPCTLKYSLQIRMYSLAALLVTLCAVYALRAYRTGGVKELVIMGAFALLAAYTHHFALAAICFVNLFLMVAVILKKEKRAVISYLVAAVCQLAGFVPGALVLLHQVRMGGAAGIYIEWNRVLFDTLAFPFLGDMRVNASGSFGSYYGALVAVGILFFGGTLWGLLWLRTKGRDNSRAAITSYCLFFAVIAASLIVSLIKRPIYLERYTMVMYTFAVIPAAYVLSEIGFKRKTVGRAVKSAVVAVLLAVCIVRAVPVYSTSYSPTNLDCRRWMDENLREGDKVVFDEIGGFTLSIYHPEYEHYFYNKGLWDVEDAYRAFGNVRVVRELSDFEDYEGRVWVHMRGESYEILTKEYGFKETACAVVDQAYYGYFYTMVLLEKGE